MSEASNNLWGLVCRYVHIDWDQQVGYACAQTESPNWERLSASVIRITANVTDYVYPGTSRQGGMGR